MVTACAWAENSPPQIKLDVRCAGSRYSTCIFEGPLQIDGPATFNFIDADAWNDANGFSWIYNADKTVQQIPSGIFQRFSKLKRVELRIKLKTVSRGDFQNATQLEDIVLDNNDLQTLPAYAFEGAGNLDWIDLSANIITTIEDFAFSSNPKLRTIILSSNALTEIKRNTFAGVDTLTKLSLDKNKIHSIEQGSLDHFPKLLTLTLSKNPLRTLPDGAFSNYPNLYKLYLEQIDLQSVGKWVDNLNQVGHLTLSGNTHAGIDLGKLARLPSLENLDVSNTSLIVPETLPSSNITRLSLAYNHLEAPNILLRLSSLKELDTLRLDNNNFKRFDGLTELRAKSPKLKRIDLNGNPIPCDKYGNIVQELRRQEIRTAAKLDTCISDA